MPKYNDLISEAPFANAHLQMSDLVMDLKREFQLKNLFNEIIYEQAIAVSPAAQLLLIVSIIEAYAMHRYWQVRGIQDNAVRIDKETIRQSLRQLIHEAKINPARADEVPDELILEDSAGNEWPMRFSLSLIKSFASRFCNIPPFCSDKG